MVRCNTVCLFYIENMMVINNGLVFQIVSHPSIDIAYYKCHLHCTMVNLCEFRISWLYKKNVIFFLCI